MRRWSRNGKESATSLAEEAEKQGEDSSSEKRGFSEKGTLSMAGQRKKTGGERHREDHAALYV